MDTKRKAVAVATLVSMVVAPVMFAADAPAMTPVSCAPSLTTVSCASPGTPVKVTAKVPASTTARVYFKKSGTEDEYYVDMRPAGDGSMVAFIPAPARSTPSFTYRVVTLDLNGVQVATPLSTATVTASCPAQSLTSDQQRASNNMIIGLTTLEQSAVPTGFLCKGIVSYIDTNGDLRQNDECRRVVAMGIDGTPAAYGTSTAATTGSTVGSTTGTTAGTSAGATSTGSIATTGSAATTGAGSTAATTGAAAGEGIGLSAGTIAALTALGLVGAGAIIYNNNHKNNNNTQVSQSRP